MPAHDPAPHDLVATPPATDLTRRLRRYATLALGSVLLATGVVMLFLPGPGLVVVLGGLAVLAREACWASRLQARLQARLQRRRGGAAVSASSPCPKPAGR